MSNVKPIAIRIALGCVVIAGIVLHQFITTEKMTLWTAITNTYIRIYLVGIATSVVITLYLNKQSAWSALTKEYPIRRLGDVISKDHAIGILNLDSPQAPTPVAVAVALTQSGILVCDFRKGVVADAMFLLPWGRVNGLEIAEPESYDPHCSEEELERRHQNLRAKLRMSRGRFPSNTIEIPWTYKFNLHAKDLVKSEVTWN